MKEAMEQSQSCYGEKYREEPHNRQSLQKKSKRLPNGGEDQIKTVDDVPQVYQQSEKAQGRNIQREGLRIVNLDGYEHHQCRVKQILEVFQKGIFGQEETTAKDPKPDFHKVEAQDHLLELQMVILEIRVYDHEQNCMQEDQEGHEKFKQRTGSDYF